MPDKKKKKGQGKGPQYTPEEQATLDWMHEQTFKGSGSPGYSVRPLVEKRDLGLGMPPAYDLVMERQTPHGVERPVLPAGTPSRSEFMKGHVVDRERSQLVPLQQLRKEAGIPDKLTENMAYFDRYRREAQVHRELEEERARRLGELNSLYERHSRGAPGSEGNPDVMPHMKRLKERTKAKVKENGKGASTNANPKTSLGVRG